jgi:hypothetical protein
MKLLLELLQMNVSIELKVSHFRLNPIYYYYYYSHLETVADRYFANEPERFESFWAKEAHQSILGQARAQRCRDKKAG